MIKATEIHYAKARRQLCLAFEHGLKGELSAELLRVFSPSAQVRGHGPGQEVLQTGKRDVSVVDIKPIGHYAIQLVFSDGHDSGIYSWTYLAELIEQQDALWADYLRRLDAAGASRDPDVQVIQFKP